MYGVHVPESIVRPSPHLEILVLVSVPKERQIRLVPDINDHPVGHLVGLHVSDDMVEIAVPATPVAVIAWIWCRGILRTICSPEIMDEKDEVGIELACAAVVGEHR